MVCQERKSDGPGARSGDLRVPAQGKQKAKGGGQPHKQFTSQRDHAPGRVREKGTDFSAKGWNDPSP